MRLIRPKKWLSSLFSAGFMDLFREKNKKSRRSQGKRDPHERYTRLFVVNFPEDTSVYPLPRRRSAGRVYTIIPSTVEVSRLYSTHTRESPYSEPQQPRVHRPPRGRTPIIERVPTSQGRRASPMRASAARSSMPPRMDHYDWAREVDRASVDAFRRGPMPRASRRRSTMPRRHAAIDREDQRGVGIPIPAQSDFPLAESVPGPPRIIHRSPRFEQERPRPRACGRAQPRGVQLEERRPHWDIPIEERWPRPEVIKDGRLGRSVAGAYVVDLARERPTRISLETRSPRPVDLNRSRRYY